MKVFGFQRMMTEKPEKYQYMLQNLVIKAQQVTLTHLLSSTYSDLVNISANINNLFVLGNHIISTIVTGHNQSLV